jgi:fructose-1,6-bisphosphatase I
MIMQQQELNQFLSDWSGADETKKAVAQTIVQLTLAVSSLSRLISKGTLAQEFNTYKGQYLDFLHHNTHQALLTQLSKAPVASLHCQQVKEMDVLDPKGLMSVAVDLLDGSANVNFNANIGLIFSLQLSSGAKDNQLENAFLQPGSKQQGAGFFVYGPQTSLVFSVGDKTHIATFDRDKDCFLITKSALELTQDSKEFSINAANSQYWNSPVKAYISDCLKGSGGPNKTDYTMRWSGALVSDAYRVLISGGVFLYPEDSRANYKKGRLHLVFEVLPIAFIVEHAGGMATDGVDRLLDKLPESIQELSPFVFGASAEVKNIKNYYENKPFRGSLSPLFGRRGLFRS